MNDKTQASSRKDLFGTEGIGEGGDGSMGQAGSSGGGTGANTTGGRDSGGQRVEGAFGEETGGGAKGRRSPANKQGVDGGQED